MEDNKEMTVIVPVRNRSGLVLRSLDSIKAQTWRPLRLIVVDNGSTDSTPKVLSTWKRSNETAGFRVDILSEPRRGASIARQRGFEAAESEYVMFFDSDDTMDPILVASVMETFAARPTLDMVTWRVRVHGLNGKTSVSHSQGRNARYAHLVHSLLRTQGYAVRRDFFRRHGGWNSSLRGWDDWELGVRLLLGDPSMKCLSEVPVDVYCREDSITGKDFSSKEGEWEQALDCAEKAITAAGGPSCGKLRRWIDYRRIILAAQYHREGNYQAAKALSARVHSDTSLGRSHKRLLWLLFHYTRKGGRGAGIPARFLL